MTAEIRDVFADTVFWVALVVKQDQHHYSAETWSLDAVTADVHFKQAGFRALLLEEP